MPTEEDPTLGVPANRIVKANCSFGHVHRLLRVFATALVKDGTYKWTDDDEITWRGEPHYKVKGFELTTNRDGTAPNDMTSDGT